MHWMLESFFWMCTQGKDGNYSACNHYFRPRECHFVACGDQNGGQTRITGDAKPSCIQQLWAPFVEDVICVMCYGRVVIIDSSVKNKEANMRDINLHERASCLIQKRDTTRTQLYRFELLTTADCQLMYVRRINGPDITCMSSLDDTAWNQNTDSCAEE